MLSKPSGNLGRVHVASCTFFLVSEIVHGILMLLQVGGVKVVAGVRVECAIERNSVRILSGMNESRVGFELVSEVRASVLALLEVGSIEVVLVVPAAVKGNTTTVFGLHDVARGSLFLPARTGAVALTSVGSLEPDVNEVQRGLRRMSSRRNGHRCCR
jgi:hypothetical protein